MPVIASISGIRGTIGGEKGESLTPIDIVEYASAYGSWIIENFQESQSSKKKEIAIVIGRDARLSGPYISSLVSSTLQAMGIHILDLGLSTTPTVEMAVVHEKAQGGIIITASHNPGNWNALKLLNHKGEFISSDDGKVILQKKQDADFVFSRPANVGYIKAKKKALEYHIKQILQLDLVDKAAIEKAEFSVVVDGINSSGAFAVPLLLKSLCVKEIKLINEEPTGVFAHNPEPLADHLHEISEMLKDGSYSLGIVVDPDVDRLAFLDENGEMFGEEYTLVAVADYVLQYDKGAAVSNLSSTRALSEVAKRHGADYYPCAVGEVNVVEKMKEVGAAIGGEGNGGIIYPKLHYGRDALVGIALLLTYLAKKDLRLSALRKSYPDYQMSKQKIELTPEMDVEAVLDQIARKYESYEVNRIDGVKIDFEDKWVHLRKSNTEPIIRIYTEASAKATADTLAKKIMDDIREAIKTMV